MSKALDGRNENRAKLNEGGKRTDVDKAIKIQKPKADRNLARCAVPAVRNCVRFSNIWNMANMLMANIANIR